MAILKKVRGGARITAEGVAAAAAAAPDDTITVPTFSFGPNDGLAQMIVDAWVDKDFRDQLLARDGQGKVTAAASHLATLTVNARGGFNLQRAVVITEKEHDNHYTMEEDNEVVFVLPDRDRIFPGGALLNTARLLMSCTPNGI